MKTSRSHANRGMGLESLIEYANAQYASKGIAQIQKVSTPWKVIRKGNQIVSAFPEKKSTVDFIGVYRGKAIAFDAKSTKNTTSFPLANVDEHQVRFIADWVKSGGIGFLLIEFASFGEIYLMPFDYFICRWDNAIAGIEKKSISYDWINQLNLVKQSKIVVLDYLMYLGEVG